MKYLEIRKQLEKLKKNPNHKFSHTCVDSYLNSMANFTRHLYLHHWQKKANYWHKIKLSDFDFLRWERLVQDTAIDAMRTLRNNPKLERYKDYLVLNLKKTGKNDIFTYYGID
jgi:hypothetical protein